MARKDAPQAHLIVETRRRRISAGATRPLPAHCSENRSRQACPEPRESARRRAGGCGGPPRFPLRGGGGGRRSPLVGKEEHHFPRDTGGATGAFFIRCGAGANRQGVILRHRRPVLSAVEGNERKG